MATAAVPALMGAQHAWADINTTTTDPFDTGNWGTPNGSAIVINSNSLELTQAANGLAGSMFFNAAQSVTNFSASFTYNFLTGSGNPADGLAFILQNDGAGTAALGGGGGSLGYNGITNSTAFEINIYAPNNRGVGNGVNGSTGGYVTAPGIDWLSTNGVNITLAYNGTYIKETVSQGANSFSQIVSVPIAGIVGATNALVGFSGATGGENAQQQVSNFIFTEGGGGATVTYGPD